MKLNRLKLTWAIVLLALAVLPAHAFYNPTTGRWLSRDPIAERGGRNLYGFAFNKPLSAYDILGKVVNSKTVQFPGGSSQSQRFDYEGAFIRVTASASAILPCFGGPISFRVHWDVNWPDEGYEYNADFVMEFCDHSVPGPCNATVSPTENYTRYPNMSWHNQYQVNLPFCPFGGQTGSVTYRAADKEYSGQFKVEFEFEPEAPLKWASEGK
jgi:hypothetical protein